MTLSEQVKESLRMMDETRKALKTQPEIETHPEDDYDYGVRLSDGTMWEECISRDFAETDASSYNQSLEPLSMLHATVVRAPARVWEEFK